MINIIKEEPSSFPEETRASFMLSNCQAKRLSAQQTVEQLARVKISSPKTIYKIAKTLLQGSTEETCENASFYRLDEMDTLLKKRLAHTALYLDSNAFLPNRNEFNLSSDDLSLEFFLLALTRSTDTITLLWSDDWFQDSLEQIPDSFLERIYERFGFGTQEVQSAFKEIANYNQILKDAQGLWESYKKSYNKEAGFIEDLKERNNSFFMILYHLFNFDRKVHWQVLPDENKALEDDLRKAITNIRDYSEAQIFCLLARQPPQWQLYGMGLRDNDLSLRHLSDREQYSCGVVFLYLICLLRQKQVGLEDLQEDKPIYLLLQEVANFPDVFTRFTIAAITFELLRRNIGINQQLSHLQESGRHRYLKSVIEAGWLCMFKAEDGTIRSFFRSDSHIKEKARVLVELLFSVKSDQAKQKSILESLKSKDWQKEKELRDLSACLAMGLDKQLVSSTSPSMVLSAAFKSSLQNLAKIYRLDSNGLLESIPESIRQDVGYYAQAIEKLPENDKLRMIPTLFDFLEQVSKGTMQATRYQHSEIQTLLSKLDSKKWIDGDSITIENLEHQFRQFQYKYKKQELQESTQLIDRKQNYIELLKLIEPNLPLPQDQFWHLAQLASEGKASLKQDIEALKELNKHLGKHHANKLITNWRRGLENIVEIQEEIQNFMNCSIVRSGDPELLFRLGTLSQNSCQKVTGDPAKNKCLLAYPCDGKNQVIYAISKGEMQQRAIIRFYRLCDKSGRFVGPALYLETRYEIIGAKYPKNVFQPYLILAAIRCAQDLQLPLFQSDAFPSFGGLSSEDDCLETINGPTPFEYFDDGLLPVWGNDDPTSRQKGSQFISGCKIKLLYDPDRGIHLSL